MQSSEFKQRFMDALFKRDVYIKDISPIQFRTRCPYCGDSSDPNKGHFYIRCDDSDNYPIMYNCFKCPAGGVVDVECMELLELDDSELYEFVGKFNKSTDSIKAMKYLNNDKFRTFNYAIPPHSRNKDKIRYIEKRLGLYIGNDKVSDYKIIVSIKDFLLYNEIENTTCEQWMVDIIDRDYVGFLSYGNSHILFRDITGKNNISWIKYPITTQSKNNMVAYSISSSIDRFHDGEIIINLCEGVLDILSIHINFYYNIENVINIAVGGKQYDRMIRHLISLGFVGNNITLNVYSDNDEQFNKKKNNYDTTYHYYNKYFKKYAYIFGKVNIYYNTTYKDYGTTIDNIRVRKFPIYKDL